jgi:P450-derived glycosyltransferase activator
LTPLPVTPSALPTTPSALGRRLQRTRVGQWFAGAQGDPYALILRAIRDDPSLYEEEVRARGPVFYSEVLDTWVIADNALARFVLADARFGALTRAGRRHHADSLPSAGPEFGPDGAQYGRGGPSADAGPAVTAQDEVAVGALAEQVSRTLLSGLGAGFDLAASFARRVPAQVLADFLGVPAADRSRFEELLAGCARSLDSWLCPQTLDITRTGMTAAAELQELLARHLGDDGPLSSQAALALAVNVAEPSSVLICNAFEALSGSPEQWDSLCRNPADAGAAVEETWRRQPPLRVASRVAQEDVELAGVRVPADGHLAVLVAAAQRDPAIDQARAPGEAGRIDGSERGGDANLPLESAGNANSTSAFRMISAVSSAALRVLAQDVPELRPNGDAVRLRRAPVTLGHARFPVARVESKEPAHPGAA